MEVEAWLVSFQYGALSYQTRRELLERVVPVYQTASLAKKTLILNEFVKITGYARKSALRLLNHPPAGPHIIRRPRLPLYGPEVQQALFLAWKSAHYVCAKRLLPSLPALVAALEQKEHLHLAEEDHRRLLTISASTAERFLRTQRKPRIHGLSTTTPGSLRLSQMPVRIFSQWDSDRPGFVEIDLVAHCGAEVSGSFLYTMTLTDLATGWTECLPLLYKSADAVLAALAQARVLFPFPLLGIDTDSGSEFLNEAVITYCEQNHLTFLHGRAGIKNDQCHVEQKNRAVVREAVGCVRLTGVQAYHQLREVYRALRLVVNCFQPSLKLQARVCEGDQVRRVYDVAQTPLHRLLTAGVLSETRQDELHTSVEQIDPLALSEHLDALRHALWCSAHLPAAVAAARPRLGFCLEICRPELPLTPKEEPEPAGHGEALASRGEILNWPRTTHDPFAGAWEEILTLVQAHPEWTSTQIVQGIGLQASSPPTTASIRTLLHGLAKIRPHVQATWEEPWPTELIQGGNAESLPFHMADEAEVASGQHPTLTPVAPVLAPDPRLPSRILDSARSATEDTGQGQTPEDRLLVLPTIAQAVAAYVQDIRESGRGPKTLEWHQTSLGALQQYLWKQLHLTDVCQLSKVVLQTWLADLSMTPSAQTGAVLAMNSLAAYARSARAFCNWLVRQGLVAETPFPQDAVPKVQQCLPRPVESEALTHLFHACHLPDENGGQDLGMTARNRAILWLLLETGLSVSELCELRLSDVDFASGIVIVRGKKGGTRTLSLTENGQYAVRTYLEQARLTPAWEPAIPEAQETLLLTELRHPLTKNSLTLLFMRLNQRAGFTTKPICPSMLRDTYAIRFLQAGGDLQVLQEQLGLADPVSVKRYQRFCDEQRREEVGTQASSGQVKPPQSARRITSKHRKVRRQE